MRFDGASTEFYQIKSMGEGVGFAKSFGLQLLAPFVGSAPIAATAHGLRHSGKTTLLRLALAPIIGQREAERITDRSPASHLRTRGNVFRRVDLGPFLIKNHYNPKEMVWKISSEGGVMPRAIPGLPGVDWIEHPTLPHMGGAHVFVTMGKVGDKDVAAYYEYFIDAMTTALAYAPSGAEDKMASAKKIRAFSLMGASLMKHVSWNTERTDLIRTKVIPQMKRMIDLTQSAEQNAAGLETGHVVGVTVIPHLQGMDRAAINFRDAVQKYAL